MAALPYLLALVGLAALVALVVAPIARPEAPAPSELPLGDVEAVERRARALTALRDLEFDHRTGKITDADYEALLPPLRRSALDALDALDSARAVR